MDILATIKASSALKSLADTGQDDAIAQQINAALPQPVLITITTLEAAAPLTFTALIGGATAMSDLGQIGQTLHNSDLAGLAGWAYALQKIGKMPSAEYATVTDLIASATLVSTPVSHDQVSAVLNPIRPVVDGSQRALPITWS